MPMESNYRSHGLLAGGILSRSLLAAIFIGAGLKKIRDPQGTQAYMKSKKMPLIPVLYAGAVAMELGVAPAFLVGVIPRVTAPILAGFLASVSGVFHDFW